MKHSSILPFVLALLFALSACGDAAAPRPAVKITLSVSELLGPTVGTNDLGEPTVTCELELLAAASGRGIAAWQDATFRIYAAGDLSNPIETTTLSADIVREAWVADDIAAETTQQSRWTATLGYPWAATMEFRYQPSAGQRVYSTEVSFTCDPDAA